MYLSLLSFENLFFKKRIIYNFRLSEIWDEFNFEPINLKSLNLVLEI